jgi:hypothetical protein
VRVASSMSEAMPSFHIEVDGVNVTGPLSVPNTGSVTSFQWAGKQGVNLTAGKHVLKVVADTQMFRLNAISVLAAASGSVSNPTGSVSNPLPNPSACANPSSGYEGYGRTTTGGAGKAVYHVKTLSDSGAGSLRDALSQGNRCIVFDVGGTISLSSDLIVRGANITIDGLTAPSPGITLKNRSLVMQGNSGAGNIVVRGIRHRGAADDAMRVYHASNVVFDRVSITGFGDGAIDVTEKARDVTIQWSILGQGNPSHNFTTLIAYGATRVTVHHNLYINGGDRLPKCDGAAGATSPSAETVCDVRNNLIWNFSQRATAVRGYGTGNIVNNYYQTSSSSAAQTIYVAEGGQAYVEGNFSHNGWNLNGNGNRSSAYSAAVPSTTDAVTAARQVLANAGARSARFGLDSVDQALIGQVKLTGD